TALSTPSSPSVLPWPRRHRKRHDVAARLGFADARLTDSLHLIDTHHRVHGNEAAADPLELAFQFLLAGIDQHLGSLTEHQLLDLQKPPQFALEDLPGIDLENLDLIEKNHPKNRLLPVFAHGSHTLHNMTWGRGAAVVPGRRSRIIAYPLSGPTTAITLVLPSVYNRRFFQESVRRIHGQETLHPDP